MGSSPVPVTTSDIAPVSSKEFLDIQATIECGFTLKQVCDIIRTDSQFTCNIDTSGFTWQLELKSLYWPDGKLLTFTWYDDSVLIKALLVPPITPLVPWPFLNQELLLARRDSCCYTFSG